MLTALALAFALAADDIPVIAPTQATAYVGQEVVVLGQVAQVGTSEDGKTLFLNFGGRYPDHVFNAVVYSGNLSSFPEAHSWVGQVIRISGKIQLYRGTGKPEIVLERQEQVTIESSTTPAQAAEPGGAKGGVVGDVPGGAVGDTPGSTDSAAVNDYDSPPRVIKMAHPQYPPDAFSKGIEGTVLIEALVDSQGRVARTRVIQSVSPSLDDAALHTCYQWVFQPAMKQGNPVASLVHLPVDFRIYTKMPEQRKQDQRAQRPAGPSH